jgi:hypothetical protein
VALRWLRLAGPPNPEVEALPEVLRHLHQPGLTVLPGHHLAWWPYRPTRRVEPRNGDHMYVDDVVIPEHLSIKIMDLPGEPVRLDEREVILQGLRRNPDYEVTEIHEWAESYGLTLGQVVTVVRELQAQG